MGSAICAVDLTKQYGAHTALSSLNLTVNRGEIFCLLGQNGAGKTTTINLFLGFIKATSGKAIISNRVVGHESETIHPWVAYIPEVVQLYGELTGLENLDFFCRLADLKPDKAILTEILVQVGLPVTAHGQRLHTYSKGMRQKVGIAIALAKNAEVIFMDEPTSGLDPKSTAEFTALCKQLAHKGKTILMATHDIFNAVAIGTRIGIMKEGRLIHQFAVADINATSLQQLYLETV